MSLHSDGDNQSAGSNGDDARQMQVTLPVQDDTVADSAALKAFTIKDEPLSRSSTPISATGKVKTQAPSNATTPKPENSASDHSVKNEQLDTNGHGVPDPDPLPVRKGMNRNKKPPARVAPLLDDLPDVTAEANSAYQVIDACTYQNKYLGYTEHAMECDCAEEWDPAAKINTACGEDSDCINRATKMECVGDCSCGSDCQNQRFWRRLYADVSVIKTEKKGHGLRANKPLRPGDFIFEYIGEVIPEGTFRKRMRQYDDEGIKHFYFMSLSKGEFVDATKKGNLGRFCNHSCNPNCYVDKWVVGDKLRMGIFAERHVRAGEELVFNYNVDRYGANPQPCYCGEDNCTGFIGGKTQTERGTKLSAATVEALGIDEEDWDAWDTMTAKRPKKKKTSDDDDEDYADRAEARDLDTNGVTKVMAALMQCKEKWIAVKLLQRLQKSTDEDVIHRIVKLHGYKIFNSQLAAWREDDNVILQILDILEKLPRLTRNKIVDAKIDVTLTALKESTDEKVSAQASRLVDEWSKLELAYRIPRKARVLGDAGALGAYDRRENTQTRRRSPSRSRSRSRSKSPPKGPSNMSRGMTGAPLGPRGAGAGRGMPFHRPGNFSRGPPPLPVGWFQATDQEGRTYFYSAAGETTWKRPSQPAAKPPPPPKLPSQQDMLKSIIDGIVTSSEKEKKDGKTSTPATPDTDKKENKEERWRRMDEEKQKKIYENTLSPHISYVMNKYKHKMPKDDLKRLAKDVAKKLVNSDYKAGRVENPTKISEKQQKKVKQYCRDYFDKAAAKYKKHEEERAARKARHAEAKGTPVHEATMQSPEAVKQESAKKEEEDDEDLKMSDIEEHRAVSPPGSGQNGQLKRKRSEDFDVEMKTEDDDLTRSPVKRLNLESSFTTPPPPPPPAPPIGTPSEHDSPNDRSALQEEPDVHADTNFKDKSMADVRALAQMEGTEEDEVDWGMDDEDNPLVEGQAV